MYTIATTKLFAIRETVTLELRIKLMCIKHLVNRGGNNVVQSISHEVAVRKPRN